MNRTINFEYQFSLGAIKINDVTLYAGLPVKSMITESFPSELLPKVSFQQRSFFGVIISVWISEGYRSSSSLPLPSPFLPLPPARANSVQQISLTAAGVRGPFHSGVN